jgi:hypothetical protein
MRLSDLLPFSFCQRPFLLSGRRHPLGWPPTPLSASYVLKSSNGLVDILPIGVKLGKNSLDVHGSLFARFPAITVKIRFPGFHSARGRAVLQRRYTDCFTSDVANSGSLETSLFESVDLFTKSELPASPETSDITRTR